MAARTFTRLRANGAPLHSVEEMREWAKTRSQLPQSIISRLNELAGEQPFSTERDAAGGSKERTADPDWQEFSQKYKPGDASANMSEIAKLRDFHLFKTQKAVELRKNADAKFHTDQAVKLEGAIHDAQLRAKKLGLETGEILRRSEVERIITGFVYYSMRCTDAALGTLSRRLIGLQSQQQVREVLEPFLLESRFFDPIIHAVEAKTGDALPEWLSAHLVDAVDNYIEQGKEKAQEILK